MAGEKPIKPDPRAIKSIEFLNTHVTYPKETRLHNRTYVCPSCGFLRRAAAHYVPDGRPVPEHCDAPMVCLSYEQTVAATHLTAVRRIEWMKSGGRVREARGKGKWRACTR
jgi:hypothetical protein